MFTKIFKTLIAVFFCMIQLLTVCAADSEMAKRYDHFIYPAIIPAAIRKHIEADRVSFLTELQRVLTQEQENLLILVDKNHFFCRKAMYRRNLLNLRETGHTVLTEKIYP